MIFRIRVPRAPLSCFVENLWFYQDLEVDHAKEKLLPDASVELIVDLSQGAKKLYDPQDNLRYTGYNRCWISGMQSRYIVIGTEKGSSMMGVHFRTGGAAPFFGFPISELTANVVELDLIWKREILSLREQLIEARTVDAKFDLLEAHLIRAGNAELLARNPSARTRFSPRSQPQADDCALRLPRRTHSQTDFADPSLPQEIGTAS